MISDENKTCETCSFTLYKTYENAMKDFEKTFEIVNEDVQGCASGGECICKICGFKGTFMYENFIHEKLTLFPSK